MRKAIDRLLVRGRDIYMTFLDLKVASDTVPREHLWKALKYRETSITLLRKIRCQYMKVKGIVRIGGVKLEEFEIRKGVKQGDSLSQLLFIIFMDQILKQGKRRMGKFWIGYWNIQGDHKVSVHLMITVQKTRKKRWPSQNTFGMWTVFENTVRRVNKCLETGGGHFEHHV
jgi:hypothetical protein